MVRGDIMAMATIATTTVTEAIMVVATDTETTMVVATGTETTMVVVMDTEINMVEGLTLMPVETAQECLLSTMGTEPDWEATPVQGPVGIIPQVQVQDLVYLVKPLLF